MIESLVGDRWQLFSEKNVSQNGTVIWRKQPHTLSRKQDVLVRTVQASARRSPHDLDQTRSSQPPPGSGQLGWEKQQHTEGSCLMAPGQAMTSPGSNLKETFPQRSCPEVPI